ncbi:hypothetical protein [Paenibacillus lentus]|uniref:Lipoprotein n=1 Tax=Paenibacillus lentus TaxID=1338368 RepID=A0A3Q8S9A3_9BACL|nr:hypothetical protein [Paenibacillus lentus]AZK45359.1 hypothetical protein EIM92_03345 [Paenibacillus lentus]
MKSYITLKERLISSTKFGLLLFIFTIIVSCTNQKEVVNQHEIISEPSIQLKIAVLEEINQYTAIENVLYVKTSLQELVEDEKLQFDGLIISKENFDEAAKMEYKNYFKNIQFPVFFLGAENILTSVFHEEELTLEDAKIGDWGPYASGFVSTEDGYTEWSLYLPNNPTPEDKNMNSLARICNVLQKYKEGRDT